MEKRCGLQCGREDEGMTIQPDTPGADDPGPGRRIGIDVGTVRIGVAVSDRDARLATPVETVDRVTGFEGDDGHDIDRLLGLIRDYDVVEVVVGLPRDPVSYTHLTLPTN